MIANSEDYNGGMNIKIPLLLTSILTRGFLGLLFSSFAAFISWVMLFQGSAIDQNTYYIKQSIVIGVPAGIVTSLIWWNTESPRFLMIIQSSIVLAISIFLPFLIVNLADIDVGTTLLGPSLRVPVISLGDILKKMLIGAVLGGNVLASLFFLYRSFFRKEM